MLQAEVAKLRSNCLTRHVGCVIVKENRQIATGYNGTPTGILNCFEGGCPRCLEREKGLIKSGDNLDRCLCTHAEANAIMQCALFGIGMYNNWIYTLLNLCAVFGMQQDGYKCGNKEGSILSFLPGRRYRNS